MRPASRVCVCARACDFVNLYTQAKKPVVVAAVPLEELEIPEPGVPVALVPVGGLKLLKRRHTLDS